MAISFPQVRRREDDKALAVGQVVQAGEGDRRRQKDHHHRHRHRIQEDKQVSVSA